MGIHGYSGLYFVYKGRFNEGNNTISLIKLLYVGESEQVRDSIVRHLTTADWRQFLVRDEELCFSVAEMSVAGRKTVRAALIRELKPVANQVAKEGVEETGFEVLITGHNRLLPDRLIVP